MQLPDIPIGRIPVSRVLKSGAELHRVFIDDFATLEQCGTEWVRTVARERHADIIGAGNPKYHTTEIDGTTGANNRQRRGFRPGSLGEARSAVRILYLGRQLADLANVLRPILLQTIVDTFPTSRTRTLAREWAWYVQRGAGEGGGTGKRTVSERVGVRVPPDLDIYDVLWLVPEGPEPAAYAWFANYNAKKRFGYKYNMRKIRKQGRFALKKKMRGFASEAARRMRGKQMPGVSIYAMFVARVMTGPQSRSRWGVPVIRVAFRRSLQTSLTP